MIWGLVRARVGGSRTRCLALLAALMCSGCLRLDVTEGGSVRVEPEGTACEWFVPTPPSEPERLTQSCQRYRQPTQVALTAEPAQGFEFRRWDGLPGWAASCTDSPSCNVRLTNELHVTAVFEPVTPPFAPDQTVVDRDGIVYLLSKAKRAIFRRSLASRRWLVPFGIGTDVRRIAYAEPSHRLHLAYAAGALTKIDLGVSHDEQPFAQLSAPSIQPDALTTVGDFVVTFHSPGYSSSDSALTVFGADGGVAASIRESYWSHYFVYGARDHLLYHLRDGVLPNDVVVHEIDPVSGAIGRKFDSPYHGDFPVSGPIVLSPDASRLLLVSGEVLSAPDLRHVRSLPRDFADAVWSDRGLMTLVAAPDGSTLLENWDGDYRMQDLRSLPGAPLRIFDWRDGFHVVTSVDGRPHFHSYVPSNDADGDRTPNREDDFPLDPAASRDTDGDGAPDPLHGWPHRKRSAGDRVYDAWPINSACQLPEDGVDGRCDIAGSIPEYVPDRVLVSDGVVHLLSSRNARIYRWSLAAARDLDPIVTRPDPTDIALSKPNGRLYIGYPDGEITQVELSLPFRQLPFAAVSYRPVTLGTAEATVVAINQPSNWYRVNTFGPSGEETPWYTWSTSYIGSLFWAPSLSRIYGRYVNEWIRVDQATHTVTASSSGYPGGPDPLTHLVRVSPDGTLALQGPRFLYRTNVVSRVGELPHAVRDAQWRDDGIVTISDSMTGGTALEQWGLGSQLYATRDLPGSPVALHPSEGMMVAVTLVAGRPAFTTYVPTADADADGVNNLSDAFPVDPAASLDSDGDGFADAWNPGRDAADSTTGLSLDAFPHDAECWAPEHERNGVCDVARRIPLYTPDVVLEGGDVVYLLSIAKQRIFRWSRAEQYHLEPIAIGPNATGAAYLDRSGRLYVSYLNGTITQLDASSEPMVEQPFVDDFDQMLNVSAAGRFLVGSGAVQSRARQGVYAEDGTKVSEALFLYPRETEWSEATSRIYYKEFDRATSRIIDQETGALGGFVSRSVVPANSAWGKLRVSPDGSRILMGKPYVYDAISFEPLAVLTAQGFDSCWLSDGFLSIGAASGNTVLERWDGALRRLEVETFPGNPIAVYCRDQRALVITASGGRPAFHHQQLDDDFDGDGAPSVSDAFPIDPAASTDSDGDGYPDAWNPGRGQADSTTGLVLDAFPNDFACHLPQHGDGGACDFDRVLPSNREAPICEVDSPPTGVVKGRLALGPTAAYLPLCDGWVAHSDTLAKRVVVQNVFDRRVGRSFPMPGKPGELALDAERHVLFVTLPDQLEVGVIDLVSSVVGFVPVPERPQELAVNRDGGLLIAVSKNTHGTLYFLPAGATSVDGGWDIAGVMIEYNAARDELVTSDSFWSDLARYSFDPLIGPTLLQIRSNAINAKELAVSPDGRHIAQAAGAGNGSGYNVWDFDGGDLTTVYGEWQTGAYPQAAAFAPTSDRFLSTQGGQFVIFDVDTHAELIRDPLSLTCSTLNVNRAAFSRGGRIATLLQTCSPNADAANIHFLVLGE